MLRRPSWVRTTVEAFLAILTTSRGNLNFSRSKIRDPTQGCREQWLIAGSGDKP